MSEHQAQNLGPNRDVAQQGQSPVAEKTKHQQPEASASKKSWQYQSNKSPDDFPDNFDE